MSVPPTARNPKPPRDLVNKQAHRVVAVARDRLGSKFSSLAVDPCHVLEDWDEVDFRLVPQPATTSGLAIDDPGATDVGCSVAGAYLDGTDPSALPIIQVAHAASSGRRAFTALHELGHHLQRTDINLAAVVWDQQSLDMFEDLACDAFAAEVLLPDQSVESIIDAKGPTASDVVALFERTGASRSAACVRASQRLPAPGHVLLLKDDGSVFFAAANGMPPLRKGSDQSGVDVVARGLRTANSRGRGRFYYRDGIAGDELFIQTARTDEYLIVVAVTDHAPWEGFTLPSRDTGPRPGSYECADPGCGATYVTFEPRCPRCGVPPCTDCGRCNCAPTVAEKNCTSCWMVKPAAFFVGDVCGDCA
ncbi:ImmA/IrrE family metallo-endopeptidase [Nocardioides sp. NPDC057767]|uniref:ImmA/IrrE family metallo-endopeptidase n=1 Tax=unclassified Nocardioides TaxID=2615069 RepID=UPI00366DE694